MLDQPDGPVGAAPAARVAVIAVHGIADQQRGDTCEEVALQLAACAGASVTRSDLPIEVWPLPPVVGYERWRPKWAGRIWKSLRHSWSSDFLRSDLGGAPRAETTPKANSAAAGDAAPAQQADLGVRYTDYLLAKAASAREGQPVKSTHYNLPRARVARADGQVDVFEMHWADLSRLPGSVMPILAEWFTLLFDVSRLGADTVSLESQQAGDRAFKALHRTQRMAHWFYSRLLAPLALQLVVCALLLVAAVLLPSGGASLRHLLYIAAALVGVALAAGLVYYRWCSWRAGFFIGLALAAAGCAAVWNNRVSDGAAVDALMLVWTALIAAGYFKLMVFFDERFKALLGTGLALLAVTLGVLLMARWGVGPMPDVGDLSRAHVEPWVQAVLASVQVMALAQAAAWATMGVLIALSVFAGEFVILSRRRQAAAKALCKQVVMTARLTLFSSLGAFMLFLMVALGLLNVGLRSLLAGESFVPIAPGYPLIGLPDSCRTHKLCDVAGYLEHTFGRHSEAFPFVALLLLGLTGFLGLIFLPSLRAELGQAAARPERLGRWLTDGYLALERFVRIWGALVGGLAFVIILATVVLVFGHHVEVPGILKGLFAWFGEARQKISNLSSGWLTPLLIWIGGGTAGLVALGRIAASNLKRLRAPLDAAIDVDNHFREFPRSSISRVRIVERYVALLDHLRSSGYTDIVIVAHSQGSVITAELLRYLQQRERLLEAARPDELGPPVGIDPEVLVRWLRESPPRLLTVGCPLRQLYALRFPALYEWVLEPGATARGPQPAGLGVAEWVNLWGSGDYVGRWLWSEANEPTPLALAVDDRAYDGTPLIDPAGTWTDRCIGGDAHTHYFELGQAEVIATLRRMASW